VRVADRLMAFGDGYGIRVLIGEMSIEHTRREIWVDLAVDLGLPEEALPPRERPAAAR
jgi:hypothetical protein